MREANEDDCIGKITSKSIITSFYSKKDLKLIKKQFFFSKEKMKNSGNCINDYAHSFFEEDY